MKRVINFSQFESAGNTIVAGLSFDVHRSLIEIGRETEFSQNGKILPFFEGTAEFEIVLEDGTVTTLSGTLALWYPKSHVKEAVKAVERAKKEEAERIKKEEIRKKREQLLSTFTEEQIKALAALGMIELEEE